MMSAIRYVSEVLRVLNSILVEVVHAILIAKGAHGESDQVEEVLGHL